MCIEVVQLSGDCADDLWDIGTENTYLRSWLQSHKVGSYTIPVPFRQDSVLGLRRATDSMAVFPKQSHMHRVGDKTIGMGENISIVVQ